MMEVPQVIHVSSQGLSFSPSRLFKHSWCLMNDQKSFIAFGHLLHLLHFISFILFFFRFPFARRYLLNIYLFFVILIVLIAMPRQIHDLSLFFFLGCLSHHSSFPQFSMCFILKCLGLIKYERLFTFKCLYSAARLSCTSCSCIRQEVDLGCLSINLGVVNVISTTVVFGYCNYNQCHACMINLEYQS